MNVLIADDNVVMRNLIKFHLKQYKFNINEVDDGLKAVKEFQRMAYDLLFLDYNMPNLDGLNVANVLKSTGVKPDIVIISSNLDAANVGKFVELGVKHFLTKPLDQKKLKDIVDKILQKRK
jgi:DNA-binding response OmpR family regulator